MATKHQADAFKPQPNKPCICNSGKKYKKCCRNQVEAVIANHAKIKLCDCVGKGELADNPEINQIKEDFKKQYQKQ